MPINCYTLYSNTHKPSQTGQGCRYKSQYTRQRCSHKSRHTVQGDLHVSQHTMQNTSPSDTLPEATSSERTEKRLTVQEAVVLEATPTEESVEGVKCLFPGHGLGVGTVDVGGALGRQRVGVWRQVLHQLPVSVQNEGCLFVSKRYLSKTLRFTHCWVRW